MKFIKETTNTIGGLKNERKKKCPHRPPSVRAKKGNQILKKTKTVTYLVDYAYITNSKDIISKNVDTFIKSVYGSASGIKTLYHGISLFRFMPYILFSLIVIPLLDFILIPPALYFFFYNNCAKFY